MTGLRLAICRRLAEAMVAASAWKESPAAASTFWIWLPQERATEPVGSVEPCEHFLAGRRVLVVDENETNRVVMGSQLLA